MKRLFLLLLATLVFIPALGSSEQPSPSVGIPVPDASITTQSDSASLEVNPAGLGYLHGGEAAYGFFLPTSDYQLVVPSGHSITLGTGGTFGGIGVGLQWLDNPALGDDHSDFRKLTLGGALSPARYLSFGGNVNFFSSRDDMRLNELHTVDFGLQFRPAEAVGFGLLARDINPAFLVEDEALPLRLGLGMALRAFNGRLVVDNELHYVQGTDGFEYRPRLAIEPLAGLRIFGDGHFGLPLPNRDADVGFQGFSVGLELSAAGLGIQGAGHLGQFGASDATAMTGSSYRIWAGPGQKRSLFQRKNRWVQLDVDESVAEQAVASFFAPPTTSFLNLLNTINAIAEDDTVQGLVLKIGDHRFGHAQIWELDQAMQRLRDAGKESVAIIGADAPSTNIVYAASVAEQVWMRPSSPYAPTGLHTVFTSYAGLLDRLGIEAEFMRIGEYKSAPETFVRTEPSDPALEQIDAYLDALYGEMVETIATRRGLDAETVREIIDETPLTPTEAAEYGLIDAVMYDDEMETELARRAGSPINLESGYEQTEIADERWGTRPEIAVVHINGLITSGESGASPFGGDAITGAETVKQNLRRLRADNNVKAVVVRIDSPGGSAVASDLVYRELRYLAQVKPVIASMGNVAASGGYYTAAGADEIFATPVTLTGSIGIYTGKFNIESLARRFGINSFPEQRGERAGVFSVWRPWSESEREGVAETLEYMYALFLEQVSNTRPLTEEEIDEVARGRVWTGSAALERQLVDHSGGVTDALRRAEELAGLETGEAVYTDRSGVGGTVFSPGMMTRVSALMERFGFADERQTAMPTGQVITTLEEMESSLMWPLYFQSGEAVFLMPYQIAFD